MNLFFYDVCVFLHTCNSIEHVFGLPSRTRIGSNESSNAFHSKSTNRRKPKQAQSCRILSWIVEWHLGGRDENEERLRRDRRCQWIEDFILSPHPYPSVLKIDLLFLDGQTTLFCTTLIRRRLFRELPLV